MTRNWIAILMFLLFVACDQGNDRLVEKAQIEGKETARAELQTQLDNMDKLVEKARAEGRATAEAELRAQIDNMGLLMQKARAEGRASAESQINSQNSNLATKSAEMEADLATRHLFYQSIHGTYEGILKTNQSQYQVRITLIPSLPPYVTNGRIRQLEELTSDINNLYFNAHVVQWNPANQLSAVGCRIEHIRPDLMSGEISIASENCPNLYVLKIFDAQVLEELKASTGDTKPSDRIIAETVATAVRSGKIALVQEMRGEVHPTTNASVYSLSVKRKETR